MTTSSGMLNKPFDDIPLGKGQRLEFVVVNNETDMPGWNLEMRGTYNSVWWRMAYNQ